MSDPLSSLANVVAVIGGAAESIKVLLAIFQRFRNAPAQVHQWLAMLESLHSTLSSLQGDRNLDARFHFSPQFQQRLLGCITQLQICTNEVAKIDAELVKASSVGKKRWNREAQKLWGRTKWAVVGDYKMKKVMDIMNFYHFEFVMELLKVLVTAECTLPPPPNVRTVSTLGRSQPQRSGGLGNQLEPPLRLFRTSSNLSFRRSEGNATLSAVTSRPRSWPTTVEYSHLDIRSAPSIPMLWSHQSVRPDLSMYWNILTCRFIIRAGSVIKFRSGRNPKAQFERYQQIGFGLILSVYLPQCFRENIGPALASFQMMVINRTTNPLNWSLAFPKTIPPDAEIFRCARAGLTENFKRLLSLGKASPTDITMFGTTLLHSASKSGSMELVGLLIREGADVNAQDEDGETPLHGAMARSNNYNVARTLIENGADLASKAVDGKTPLHNIFNDTIGQVLARDDWLENMPPDSEAMSITHFLAWSSKSTPEILERGHLYDDADLLSADVFGRNCLHLAASRGNLRVLCYLMSRVSSVDVEKKDFQGRTPLHYAVESSRAAAVIDMLADKGCNLLAVDNAERNALHWAARWNNSKAVKKLIDIVGEGTLVFPDANGRLPSQEVSERRVPALYVYLRDLESCSGLNSTLSSDPTRSRRDWTSYVVGRGFALVLKVVGILALLFLILFGAPN